MINYEKERSFFMYHECLNVLDGLYPAGGDKGKTQRERKTSSQYEKGEVERENMCLSV
jgi:hypothetical protein